MVTLGQMNFSSPKPQVRHQSQVSSMFKPEVNNKWPFGHSSHSEGSKNDLNEFLIPKKQGIDTKIKSLACLDSKLRIWLFYFDWTKWPFGPFWCLKMVPMSLPCQKTWNRHQKQVSTTFRTKVINLSQIDEILLVKMAIWPPGQI